MSIAFFIPILITFVQTGLVPKFPTLIVCGFMILAAIQSLFAGLILSNIGAKDRRDFEYKLTSVSQQFTKKKKKIREKQNEEKK